MGVNEQLEELVNSKFTEETLKTILIKHFGGKVVGNVNFENQGGTAKGDSYLSTVNKLKVKGEVDGSAKSVDVIVKSLPQNIARRKTYRSVEFFTNEINFYEQVIPKFGEFLKGKGQEQMLSVPNCLIAYQDGENDFLALEDVSPLGYGPASRQNGLNLSECLTILKTLANFHAVSFAYKDHHPQDFQRMVDCLLETYYSDEHWDWYDRFNAILERVAKDALEKECPGSQAQKKFNSYKHGDLYKVASDFCGRKGAATSVITQGDSWAPNYLVRRTDKGEEVMMIDFQLTRCSSAILDVSFLVYSCTSKELRDNHFQDLLKAYHDEISKGIKNLGSNPEKLYPWKVFMKEVKEQFIFGMIFSMEAVPFCLLDESDAFDLDVLQGDKKQNIADVWTVANIKTKEGRRRLADIIVHAAENQFM